MTNNEDSDHESVAHSVSSSDAELKDNPTKPLLSNDDDQAGKDDDEVSKTSKVVGNFSTTEKLVLEEFMKEVPEIFKEVYGEDTTEPIEIWGVIIDRNSLDAPSAKAVYMKFIRGRYLSVRDAREMMISILKWRKDGEFEKMMQPTKKERWELLDKMNISEIKGTDTEGRPVIYHFWGKVNWDKLFENAEDKESRDEVRQDFVKWRMAFMERCIKKLDFINVDHLLQVHDYTDVPFGSRNKNARKTAEMVTRNLLNYYPDFLHWKLMVNVPFPLPFIFWLGKSTWMTYQVYDKVDVSGRDLKSVHEALAKYIPDMQVHQKYRSGALAGEKNQDLERGSTFSGK